MELKDIWEDLQDKVAGDENSGSKITVDPINNIAHSVIKNEENIFELENKSEPFYVTFTTQDDSDEDVTITNIDKTFAETLEAYNAGRKVVGIFNGDGNFMDLVYQNDSMFTFSFGYFNRITTISFYDIKEGEGTQAVVYENQFMPDTVIDNTPTKGSDNLITSGGVYDAIGHWELIVNTTLEEEVNSIELTSEEYPDIPKCKEFVIRVVFPKTTTGADIALGASSLWLNNNAVIAFRFGSTTLKKNGIAEQRAHISIIDNLVYSTGTYQSTGQSAVTASPHVLIGDRLINGAVSRIIYKLNESTNNYPIGTKFAFYGKVN